MMTKVKTAPNTKYVSGRPRVHLVSLGCAKNSLDSEIIAASLQARGFDLVSEPGRADLIVVNTCGFIREAVDESLDCILEAVGNVAQGNCRGVVVSGCLTQRYGADLSRELSEVSGFIGVGNAHRAGEVCEAVLQGERVEIFSESLSEQGDMPQRRLFTPPHYAYLRIADGCSNHCSYCLIPQIRGPFRPRAEKTILAEARGLAHRGAREIIAVAQDTTQYSHNGCGDLTALLRKLVEVDGPDWVRLMYIHPRRATDELVNFIAGESRMVKYLDIPLQHCNDALLRAMNRGVTRNEICRTLDRIREKIPEVALRTTFMVGFPGETEAAFQELYDFIEQQQFDRLGVFAYSREEGTAAARMSRQLSQSVKEERRAALLELQERVSLEKNCSLVGETLDVLVDREGAPARGRSYRDAPEVDGQVMVLGAGVAEGSMVRVRITDATEHDLLGEAVGKA